MDTQLLQILRWAAGASENLSLVEDVDEKALLALVAAHNISSRFFNRLQEQRPAWMTRTLSIGAFTLNRRTKEAMQRQVTALREIVQAMPADAGPVIPIKGLSIYALTGETNNLRASGDIDLYAADPERLWEALTRLGYTTDDKRDSGSHCAVMHRSGVQIEVHRHFSAWDYPPEMSGDMRPSAHPGVWMQPFTNVHKTEIHYRDIAEYAAPSPIPQMQGLTMPSPAMMTLLLCLHVFRHYIEGRALPTPVVRLCEIADIRDLSRSPQFQQQHFQMLTHRFSAHNAVRFVRHLIRLYLKADLPASSSDVPPQSVSYSTAESELAHFPQRLSLWSGWGAICLPDELLQPQNPKKVFDRLEPNVIKADGTKYSAFSLSSHAATRPLSKIIIQDQWQEQIPVSVCAYWNPDVLKIDIEIFQLCPPEYHYQVLLFYPYQFYAEIPAGFEIPYTYSNVRGMSHGSGEKDEVLFSDDCNRSRVCFTESGSVTNIPLTWASLPPVFQSSGCTPLMVLILKMCDITAKSGDAHADASILLPLNVVRP